MAYTVAIKPEDQTLAVVGLARIFRREMQWRGLQQALALPLAPRTPPISPGRALPAAHLAAPYSPARSKLDIGKD